MTLSLVTANGDISWAKAYPGNQVLQVMSNAHILCIYKDTGSGTLYYRTSPDSGTTWTSGTAVPGNPTPTGLQVVAVVSDVLYLWYAGSSIQVYTSTFNTSTNLLGSQTVYSYAPSGVTSIPILHAAYADGAWHVVCEIVKTSGRSIAAFKTPGSDGTLSTFQQYIDLNYPHTALSIIQTIIVSGFLYAVWYDTTTKQLWFAPIVRNAGSFFFSSANLELVTTLVDANATFSIILELTGAISFVIVNSSLLYAIQRVATATYSQIFPLQAQAESGQVPALVLDGTDLYVLFETTVSQPNGEAWIIRRTGGPWGLPGILVGGDAFGYGRPIAYLEALLFQDASNNLWFLEWFTFGAPNAPTGLAPTGTIATVTPTVSWRSNKSAPTDPTKSHQVQTYRVSDNHLMDDSGEVFTGATTYSIPGGAGLVYNTAYKFQVREKDSLSALGAGTWGPYSSAAVFTPMQPSVPVIASITSGGVTVSSFPATIAGADLQAHVTYTDPDAHATNAYQFVLYAADDVTVLALQAMQPLGPPIASGGNFNTNDWTGSNLQDAHTYHVAVRVADATTGEISESAHRQITTAFAPPPPVSAFTVTPDNNAGTVTLAWTNPGDAVSTLVEWQPYTESGRPLGWFRLGAAGQLWNHMVTATQAPQLRADYRVTVIDSRGIASSVQTVEGVLLGNALDYAGIWLNDLTDMFNTKVFIGYVDNWDALKRDRVWDMQEWVPLGAEKPVQTFGLANSWILGTSQALKIFFPSQDTDEFGNVYYGADNRDMALGMANSHNVLQYRDRRFPLPIFVKFWQYEDQPNDDINTDLTLELHETSYFGGSPVVGSLV